MEELERVQSERDQMAAQIKHDAETLEEKVNSAKQQGLLPFTYICLPQIILTEKWLL